MTRGFEIDSAHGGDGWHARVGPHKDDIGTIWSTVGSNSEYGALRRVMLHLPGLEFRSVDDPRAVDWYEIPDQGRAADQIRQLADIYGAHGVEVLWLEPTLRPMPNHLFLRDLFIMTPAGAIVSRMAGQSRAGEEVDICHALARNAIPILRSLSGSAVFEGPDVLFFRPDRAFVATSIRSNKEGARQVSAALTDQGIDVTEVQTTFGCGHLDGVVALLNEGLALVHPQRVSYTLCAELRNSGYAVVALPDQQEADRGMAINMVSLTPDKVILSAGNPKTQRLLAQCGVQSIAVAMDEVMKAGGSVHCVTGVLQRDLL